MAELTVFNLSIEFCGQILYIDHLIRFGET